MSTTQKKNPAQRKRAELMDYNEYLRLYGKPRVENNCGDTDDSEVVARTITSIAGKAFEAAFGKKSRPSH